MSDNAAEEREREEFEMLLPWYATGTLDNADKLKVERYLALHPQVSAQLDLVRAEREQSVLANDALGSPSAGAVDRLMASLPSTKRGVAQGSAISAVLQQIGEFFTAPTARGVRWATLAAALLVAVQAAAITTLMVRDGGNTYQTASGQTGSDGMSALVVFAQDAQSGAISQLLSEFEASIVDGPKPGGVYKIRLRTPERSPAGQEKILQRLAERRDIVTTVVPSKD